jgi:hypothetical protein
MPKPNCYQDFPHQDREALEERSMRPQSFDHPPKMMCFDLKTEVLQQK